MGNEILEIKTGGLKYIWAKMEAIKADWNGKTKLMFGYSLDLSWLWD